MKKLSVHTLSPYTIQVGNNLLLQTATIIKSIVSSGTMVIVSDSTVYPLYGEPLRHRLKEAGYSVFSFVFPPGELSKQMKTVIKLYDFLTKHQVTRSDLLIALGGGVVGDLTGFAAATYLRGIDYIQIPTTLLAQIDSSVGGKTAVNIPAGKNLVGAFYQPKLVLCDITLLSTLSQETLADGMAEAIKYAAIFSGNLLEQIQSEDTNTLLNHLIPSCIEWKKQLVEEDERDNGNRMLLNFGHTFGHAIEKIHHYRLYTHGQSVSLGMLLITELSEKYGLTQPGTVSTLRSALKKYGLPTEITISPKLLYQNSLNDKKRQREGVTLALIHEIGKGFLLPLSLESYWKFLTGVYS